MRIGLIAPPWLPIPPTGYGGTETAIHALAVSLQAAGHTVLLAAPSDSTCPVERLGGFAPAQRSEMGHTNAELPHVVRAYRELSDVDIIHDHTLAGPLYRHRPADIPVVCTIHSAITAALRPVYEAISRDVSLLAISQHQADTAPGVRIRRVIHHGLDTSAIPVGAGTGGYACFLGRIAPAKGVVEAIEVARRAGIRLKIAAKMSEREELDYFHSAVEPLLGANEEFLGEVDSAGKFALLGGAVALLNPLQWDEPFGLVMIEALASGTPVVATPRGAAPEIIDDGVTGFLGSGTEELALALQRAAGLGRQSCRAAVESRFSAELMARRHAELFDEVLAEGR
ncbi:glycosyltransferase family 4 protein [Arthrobacter sp. CJ23]|uniref:glycosyltransferase family 4 protein n=1 Tax=Arthrobacter sp. CJ23 TaxID=2972479 RepID=UPI00215D1686|nr:glycosyltransferase family 4 protein [Arthrobacter sp. CJ23]UVJ40029.1 glycosyltransferase family 4 protein [Arthrobacter sp. CJ23]